MKLVVKKLNLLTNIYEYILLLLKTGNSMISKFFSLDGRPYVNNAIVLAEVLSLAVETFGNVKNLNIKFKKPLTTQAKLEFSTIPLEGDAVGSFDVPNFKFHFAYTKIQEGLLSENPKSDKLTYFDLCYGIQGRDQVQEEYEKEFGPIGNAKVIVTMIDVPDTQFANKIIESGVMPTIELSEIFHTGNKKYKYDVLIGGTVFATRYAIVKEFNL